MENVETHPSTEEPCFLDLEDSNGGKSAGKGRRRKEREDVEYPQRKPNVSR